MRNSIFALSLVALFSLVLSGCGGPIETLVFESPEGDRSITVSGVRETGAGPIVINVTLKTPGITEDFEFEHQAGSLTNDNCTAKWIDNQHCLVNFVMGDGEAWQVDAFLMDDRLKATKIFKLNGSIF